MGDIIVKYNGTAINPTPVVSQTYQFVDLPTRWGNILQLQLDGLLSGITTTGSIYNLVNIFAGNFGLLQVYESDLNGNPNNVILSWSGLYVSEIGFPNNAFAPQGFAPYSIKLRSFGGLPSGVTDPINEYNFVQGQDSIVTLTNKISARGIKNSNAALSNAISFVQSFTGLNPYASLNVFSPSFMPSGAPILMSMSETINRADNIYTVNQIYKYVTGSSNSYIDNFTLEISDIVDNEYLTMDAAMKIQASPVNKNLSVIESLIPSISIISKINDLGIATGNLYIGAYSVTRDTGAATVDIKSSYISGYSQADMSGYFDYLVTFDKDVILPRENWRIEGEWVCAGPLDYKIQQLNIFKSTYGNNWRGYLSGLITGSALWNYCHNPAWGLEVSPKVQIEESTGIGLFKLSSNFSDSTYPVGVYNAKYTLDSEPSKWDFQLLPSATIEGQYVVQDLQMRTQSKVGITVESDCQNPGIVFSTISGLVNSIANIYVPTAYLQGQNLTTGNTNISFHQEWLGNDTVSSGLLYSKIVGSQSSNYCRQPGFSFGF